MAVYFLWIAAACITGAIVGAAFWLAEGVNDGK